MLTKDKLARSDFWIQTSPAMENFLEKWSWLNPLAVKLSLQIGHFVEPKTESTTHGSCSLQQTSQIVESVTNSVHNQSIQLIQQWIWRAFLLQASIFNFYIGWNNSLGSFVQSINATLAVKVGRLKGIPDKELNSKIFQHSAAPQYNLAAWFEVEHDQYNHG